MIDTNFDPEAYFVVRVHLYNLGNACVGLLANTSWLHKQTMDDMLRIKGSRKGMRKRKKVNCTSGIKQLVNVMSVTEMSPNKL